MIDGRKKLASIQWCLTPSTEISSNNGDWDLCIGNREIVIDASCFRVVNLDQSGRLIVGNIHAVHRFTFVSRISGERWSCRRD